MQYFQDNEKKKKWPPVSYFFSAKFVLGYPSVRPYILFHIPRSSYFPVFLSYRVFEYHKITGDHFEIFCFQKVIRLLADRAEYVC